MAQTPEVGSPRWWLDRLWGRLMTDQGDMLLMDRYYTGDHPLPDWVPREIEDAYRSMLERAQANICELVVDAEVERLNLMGFRAAGDTSGELVGAAWRLWTENGLDSDIKMAFTEALIKRRSYLMVWRENDDGAPRISVEDPLQVIVEHEPGNRRRRAAALKVWVDDWTGSTRANVYLPDALHKFTTSGPDAVGSESFTELLDGGSPVVLPNPFDGVVPVIPIYNRPRVLCDGSSELRPIYLIQDRINENLFNRQLAAWTVAVQQRWATGLELDEDEDGETRAPFKAAWDKLWTTDDPDVKFGAFPTSDLKPIIESIEQDVELTAVISRTPRHYFLVSGQSPSGDAMKSAETGLVAKVISQQPNLGAGPAEAVSLALGLPRLEVVWRNAEFRVETEATDAAVKKKSLGIPLEQIAEDLDYTPTEVARWPAMRAQEALLGLIDGEDVTETVQ